ncbi:MAG: S8 family serine peptidase, partial [Acidobacteriota bacterium]|nr:S8 family serine peptidase [Acidobacteriota bacterium]
MSLLLMTSLFSGLLVNGSARAFFSQAEDTNQKRKPAAASFKALSRYAFDLTEMAGRGELTAAEGNDTAIRRTIKVLAKSDRNNPVLIDESGADRKLVIEGVAIKMASGRVPDSLRGKHLWELNFNALAAAAKSPAEVQSRLKSVLDEVAQSHGQVILFIDELPSLLSTAALDGAEVSAILQDSLTHSRLNFISATSGESYGKFVSENEKLRDYFQAVKLGETAEKSAKNGADDSTDTEFVGDKISPDLRDLMNSAGSGKERAHVILQADDANDAELRDLLRRNGVSIKDSLNQLGALNIELPLQAIEKIASSNLAKHLSLDRKIVSFGHVTATTGTDLVRTQPSGSLINGLLTTTNTTLDGSGIGIAIIDSGIDAGHVAFATRVKFKKDFTYEATPGDKDYYGHGAHVASAAAGMYSNSGSNYDGIARNANIISLRVLDSNGQGKTSDLLNAINWILNPVDPTKPLSSTNPTNATKYNIRVVNMSLGAPAVDSYKNDVACKAVRKLVDAGIVVVVAAGNNGKDSAGNKIYGQIHSPGDEPSAITVGAANTYGTDSRSDDGIATYSSRGPTRGYW